MTATPAPPTWLLEAEAALRADLPSWFTDFAPPPDPQRRSAYDATLRAAGDGFAPGPSWGISAGVWTAWPPHRRPRSRSLPGNLVPRPIGAGSPSRRWPFG